MFFFFLPHEFFRNDTLYYEFYIVFKKTKTKDKKIIDVTSSTKKKYCTRNICKFKSSANKWTTKFPFPVNY